MSDNWMASPGIHPGGLHASLGVPQGQKIPPARIKAAENSPDEKVRKQATLAETFARYRPT